MSRLFEPLLIGELNLKNRIVLAPMTRGRAGQERVPNDLMAEYYYQRSGAGMLVTEATVISKQGIGWIGSPGIFTEEMVEGWKKVTEKVKPTGTSIFLQLWHCGRASHSDFHNGELPVSASAVKLNGDAIQTPLGKKPYETPRALSLDEIKATVKDFRKAAENAREAGFSGQFLDSKTNLRNDEYGGSIENKFRFFKEVVEAVLEVWPPEQVGAHISPNGIFNDGLNRLKIGYLHVVDGLAFGFHEKGEPMTLKEIRKVYKGTIIGNCGYTRETAEERIAEGSADMISFGRPFITNPDLPERFRNNWPLNPFDDMSFWYTPGSEGYTDYEPYK
jgi:N-ethylmaleimide reductase